MTEDSPRIVIAKDWKIRPNTACCCLGPENGEPLCRCRMRSIDQDIAALSAAGYAIVPKEPTPQMVERGLNTPRGMTDWAKAVEVSYRAMIAEATR